MNGKSLAVVICALLAGILFGRLDMARDWMSIFPLVVAIAIYLFDISARRSRPLSVKYHLKEAVAFLIFSAIGNFSYTLQKPVTTEFQRGEYAFTGKVVDYSATNNGDKLLVALSSLSPAAGDKKGSDMDIRNVKALITLLDASNVTYGSRVSGLASLSPSNAPGNTLHDDFNDYLAGKNIFLTGIANGDNCRVETNPTDFLSFFLHLRERIEASVESTALDADTRNFLISVLLGDKSYISEEERISFSDAGVSHIFAVSGLHVSIIGLFLTAFLSLIFFGKNRKWKYLLCLPPIWFYVLLTGLTPATCRAGIMLSIALVALFLQRKHNPLKALGWSVILILSLYPSSLFDVGFQLSVISVGSLLLIAQPLNFMGRRSHPYLFKIVSLLLVTLTASLSTWIICAFYFHKFSLLFLPLNVVAVPLLPLYLGLGIVYVTLNQFGLRVTPIENLLDFLYDKFSLFASDISSISASVDNLHPGGISVLLWIAALLSLAYILTLKKPLKRAWVPAAAFTLSLLSIPIFNKELPKGFIIQKNSKETSLACYEAGRESFVNIPAEGSAHTMINDKNILTLRNDELSQEVIKKIPLADIIIISNGCRNLPEEVLNLKKDDSLIVTHPSLHWRYEKKILAQASETNLAVHSIRYDGPLHVF